MLTCRDLKESAGDEAGRPTPTSPATRISHLHAVIVSGALPTIVSSASSHGTPMPTVRWENAAAPMAAKLTWHIEICPDVRTRRLSDSKRMVAASALAQSIR